MSTVLPEIRDSQLGPCPVIKTGRLVLRPHRMSDADAITRSLSDFAVTRMLSRVPLPYDRQDALDWLHQITRTPQRDWCLAITRDGETHIGTIGLELRHGQWHLGYWLNHDHWGQGLMSEAVCAALDLFFARLADAVLHSGVFADNPASLRIQEKLGFKVVRSADIYCLARNSMVAHIETELRPSAFQRPA